MAVAIKPAPEIAIRGVPEVVVQVVPGNAKTDVVQHVKKQLQKVAAVAVIHAPIRVINYVYTRVVWLVVMTAQRDVIMDAAILAKPIARFIAPHFIDDHATEY